MPRYIDADELYKSEIERCHCVPLIGSCSNDNKSLRDVLEEAPTVDVVPRSEVEELKVELKAMRGAANSYKLHYEQAKQEVARKIFAEMDILGTYNPVLYAELKKKYIGE